MQFINIFGKLMKIDEDFEIDVCTLIDTLRHSCWLERRSLVLGPNGKNFTQDLENECLKTGPSEKLMEIGLCLLKWVSSHRGLTYASLLWTVCAV